MDCDQVHERLWLFVGARPDDGTEPADAGFTMIVTTAGKGLGWWPNRDKTKSAPLHLHFGLTDDAFEIVRGDLERASAAMFAVVSELCQRGKVLVTCSQGLNRSGWVAAWAIVRLTGISGAAAIEQVQKRRTGSLYNHFFCEHLKGLSP